MNVASRISSLFFTRAPSHLLHTGLLGWVTFRLDDLRLDGVAVRVTQDGRMTLSYPARRDGHGRQHPYALPVGAEVRQAVEDEVLARIRTEVGL